jgi:endonuclease YncB( thermonuclease family)
MSRRETWLNLNGTGRSQDATLRRSKGLLFRCLSIFIFICAGNAVGAEHRSGRVTHIVDGDTLDIMLNETRVRVRLLDIDAPKQGQADGIRSRQSLIQICGGGLALLDAKGRDRNGRVLGRVTCNGTDAGSEQVRRGMAWVFDRYSRPESPLYAIQDEARAAHRGLWARKDPVPPWDWRQRQDMSSFD